MIRKERGFTLIELLVVIAIIAILAAILFPVFARAKDSARQVTCASNLKNISAAVSLYSQQYGKYPPASADQNAEQWKTGWPHWVSPYLQKFKSSGVGLDSADPKKVPAIFLCPNEIKHGPWGDYGANYPTIFTTTTYVQWGFKWVGESNVRRPSKTALIMDAAWRYSDGVIKGSSNALNTTYEWHKTNPDFATSWPRWSRHNGGIDVAFVDGHVQWVRKEVIYKNVGDIWGLDVQK